MHGASGSRSHHRRREPAGMGKATRSHCRGRAPWLDRRAAAVMSSVEVVIGSDGIERPVLGPFTVTQSNAGPCSVTIRDPNHTMVAEVWNVPGNNGVVALKRATLFAAAPGMAEALQ